jgi:pentalenolactone synthase
VAAIDKGVLLLVANPFAQEALQRDPTLIPKAVEEILRSAAPLATDPTASVGGLPRYANAAIELESVTIQPGELVLLDLQGANLDEPIFPAPETFEVTRAANPHLTFGHGLHYCIGASLARIERQTLFGTLIKRFPTLRLAVPVAELR